MKRTQFHFMRLYPQYKRTALSIPLIVYHKTLHIYALNDTKIQKTTTAECLDLQL